jgi:hypothetical protein
MSRSDWTVSSDGGARRLAAGAVNGALIGRLQMVILSGFVATPSPREGICSKPK